MIDNLLIEDAWSYPEDGYCKLEQYINSAEKSVCISIYLIADNYIADLLIKCLERGVKVKLMLDSQFFEFTEYYTNCHTVIRDELNFIKYIKSKDKNNLFEARWGNDNYFLSHAKYILIDVLDDDLSYIPNNHGSCIISTSNLYCYRDEQFFKWSNISEFGITDFSCLVTNDSEPEAIQEIANVFQYDWNNQSYDLGVHNSQKLIWCNGAMYFNASGEEVYPENGRINVANISHYNAKSNARESILQLMDSAKQELIIYSDEFYDAEILLKIFEVANKGVKVKLLLSNQFPTEGANDALALLLRLYECANVELYIFYKQNTKEKSYGIHAKTFLIDYGSENAQVIITSSTTNQIELHFSQELGFKTNQKHVLDCVYNKFQNDVNDLVSKNINVKVDEIDFDQGAQILSENQFFKFLYFPSKLSGGKEIDFMLIPSEININDGRFDHSFTGNCLKLNSCVRGVVAKRSIIYFIGKKVLISFVRVFSFFTVSKCLVAVFFLIFLIRLCL